MLVVVASVLAVVILPLIDPLLFLLLLLNNATRLLFVDYRLIVNWDRSSIFTLALTYCFESSPIASGCELLTAHSHVF